MDLFPLDALETVIGPLDEERAERARARAESYLHGELAIELGEQSRTVSGRVRAVDREYLLRGPIVSVESVTVDDVAVPAADWEITDRGIWCANGFGRTATAEWVALEVTYTGGLASADSDLAEWGVYLAILAYQLDPIAGVAQQTVGGVFTTIQPDIVKAGNVVLPDHALRALKWRYGDGRRVVRTVALGCP